MKNFASTRSLLFVWVGGVVLWLGSGACGGSSSGSSPPLPAGDSGATEASARDSSMPDTSVIVFDSSVYDTAAPDAGDDAEGGCGTPQTSLGMACDDCVGTNCEATWCACAADLGSAGSGGCQEYAKCVEGCVATDAGSPTDCLTTVCAVPPFTTSEEKTGAAFLGCLVQYCGNQCGQ
jgi:hypothetical protein